MTEHDGTTTRIRAAIRASIEDVEDAGVPTQDRTLTLALVLAARLLEGVNLGLPAPSGGTTTTVAGATQTSSRATSGDLAGDPLDRIGARLELDRDAVEAVYLDKDGDLSLVVNQRRLSIEKAAATRDLALLIAAGRQAAGLEEWTPTAVVRPVVAEYGRLDGPNFSAHINKMDKDGGVILTGKGTDRQIKVNRVGFGLAADLVKRLTSAP